MATLESGTAAHVADDHVTTTQLSEEDQSKDAFFVKLGELAEAMIARHGKDFAMGTLLLSARFIAENKPLVRRSKEPAN